MKLRLLTLLFLCFASTLSFATEVTISGTVTFGPMDFEEPAEGYPVHIYSNVPNPDGTVLDLEVFTDENGEYSATFDIEPTALGSLISVEVFNFCTGEILIEELTVIPGDVGVSEVANFHVCQDFNPPPPPMGCEAFFFYEQLSVDPYTIQFLNLSYSDIDVVTWLWDFGDGTSSNESDPIHDYSEVGIYEVSLIITTDSCESTFLLPVEVLDQLGCGCDAVYNPVCVLDWATGEVLEFSNPCFAECAGFGPDSYTECEDDCVCPDVYDPVCVITAAGIIFTFENPCYAECEGFGPDSFVDCNPDPCDCYAFFGPPVCVVLDDGTELHFINACYAECEGYGPDQYFYCDNPDGCFANFWVNYSDDPASLVVGFEDHSFSNLGDIQTWEWNFGDGATSSDQNPSHEYAEAGIYEVTLTIVTDAGCTATITQHICVGFIDDCVCPDVYDPVCVELASGTILFANLCEAECAGFTAMDVVDCGDDPCVCPEYYDPVCVIGPDGDILQFDNICFALCEGYGPDSFVDCEDDCVCPDIYAPVCVVSAAGNIITFSNACFATCEGYGPDSFVDCEDDCICPSVYDPVCVITAAGEVITFQNECFAACEGFGPDSFVPCEDDCVCPDIYDPVCVMTVFGVIITFENECFAACEGFGPDSYVDCEDNCVCPAVYDPVCVVAANGDIITFENACFAACEGYGPDSFVSCGNDCPCDDIFEPVCVYTAAAVLFFPNACEAECAGFGPDTHVDCEDDGNICHAFFFLEQDAPDGLIVNFIDGSETEEGTIESWQWDFGDGNSSDVQNPEHEYAGEGIYEVTLTITTSEGCTSTFVQHICIGGGGVFGGPDCQAMFFFDQNADDLTTFSFYDMSIGEANNWAWDFGDGNTSDEQNPVHTYDQPGVYIVTLTISTDDCESSVAMLLLSNDDIWYDNQCVALFLPLIIPDANQVFFLNLSSQDAVSFEWDFGDGTTSNEFIVIHEYAEAGTFEVSLTITTEDGCTNTFSVTLDLAGDDFMASPSFLTLTDTEEPESLDNVRLYPNPAIDDLVIGFESTSSEDYQLEILSANGQLVQRNQVEATTGNNVTELKISNLTPGLYLLRISTASGSKTMKFVKQ